MFLQTVALLKCKQCCCDVQSLFISEYKVHSHNRNGLCAVAFMDDHYLVLSAFSLLNMVLTIIPETPTCLYFWFKFCLPIVSCSQPLFIQFCLKFVNLNSDSWKSATADGTQEWAFLTDALTKFQVQTFM